MTSHRVLVLAPERRGSSQYQGAIGGVAQKFIAARFGKTRIPRMPTTDSAKPIADSGR